MKTHLRKALGLLALAAVGACTTETEIKNPSYQSIDEAMEWLYPAPQTYAYDAAQWGYIIGQKGTQLTIPPNAFVYPTGVSVSGQVDIELLEVFSPGDMIRANKMTTSGGNILSSGGELFFKASQNGMELDLAQGASINFKVPTANPTNQMGLFVGNDNNGTFDWVQDTTTAVTIVSDSLGTLPYQYDFSINTLWNWINCDYFYNDPRPLTDVEIQAPSGYDGLSTVVFIYIPSINGVTRIYNSIGSTYYANGGYKLPVGLQVEFVSVHYDGTDYYLAYQTNTIVQNHVEVLTYTKYTQAQINQFLQNL